MARTREDVLFELELAREREDNASEAANDANSRQLEATAEVERLEDELDDFDSPLDGDELEADESMDGDHESALASAGFGTDEDYEHNDIDSMDGDYDQPEIFDYPEFDE